MFKHGNVDRFGSQAKRFLALLTSTGPNGPWQKWRESETACPAARNQQSTSRVGHAFSLPRLLPRAAKLPIAIMGAHLAMTAQAVPVPQAGCSQCTRNARGTFKIEARHVVSYKMPADVIPDGALATAPWTFDLIVDATGQVCSVQLKKGPESVVSKAMLGVMKSWRFTPVTSQGITFCFRSTVFVYARYRDGRPTLIVPGLTEP